MRLRVPLACSLVLAWSAPAGADDDAATLFERGRTLMTEQRFDEACATFAQSFALAPQVNTLGHLARCHEKQGKLATALAEYRRTAAMARAAADQERAEAADKLAQGLEAQVPSITVVTSEPGVAIRCDGQPLESGSVSLDPGSHTIEATKPGREPWLERLELRVAEQRRIVVPLLEPVSTPVAPPAADASPEEADGPGARLVIGLSIGGLGVAGLVVGTVLGAQALGDSADVDELCLGGDGDTETCPPGVRPAAEELNEDARRAARGSNIALVVGGAGVVAGAILVLTSSTLSGEQARGPKLVPVAGPLGGGVWLDARF